MSYQEDGMWEFFAGAVCKKLRFLVYRKDSCPVHLGEFPLKNNASRWIILIVMLGLFGLLAVGCSQKTSKPTQTPPLLSVTPTSLPTDTPMPSPTSTSLPPLAVLLAPPGSDAAQVQVLQSALNELITAAGLRWQVRPSLSLADFTPELRLVIVLPPDPGVAALAGAAPQTQFLSVAIPGVEPAANLSTIAAGSERSDQQGFIAGVIATLITPDWRVGTIGLAENVASKAAENAFINGGTYFCGLCLQAYPPFYDYPMVVNLPATASAAEWREIGNYMIDHMVQTVYVVPGAGNSGMFEVLAEANVNVIGENLPSEALRAHWVVSLRPAEILPVVLELLPDLLGGKAGVKVVMPLTFLDANPDLFSPGRQRLAQETLDDLLAGFIDTGVDQATGENR
jgi:hypothetical protein